MLFSNLELHLTTTRSSTFSGFKLALMGVTTLPATEKTRSNLDEVAGTGKTLLTSLARRGTESRDASPITAGPLWTAHQATVGKTSFFTPWGTLNFFSSSYSSSFTISLLRMEEEMRRERRAQWMASLAGPGWARRGGCHRMLNWCVSILPINIYVFDLLHYSYRFLNKCLDY